MTGVQTCALPICRRPVSLPTITSFPEVTANHASSFMLYHEGWYLFTYSTNDNITLKRSRALTDNWDLAETKLIFKPDPSSGDPWSTDVCSNSPALTMASIPQAASHAKKLYSSGLQKYTKLTTDGTSSSAQPQTLTHPIPFKTQCAHSSVQP